MLCHVTQICSANKKKFSLHLRTLVLHFHPHLPLRLKVRRPFMMLMGQSKFVSRLDCHLQV